MRIAAFCGLCLLLLVCIVPEALAQSPLAGPSAPAGEPGLFSAILAQIARWQSQLHREMAALVRATSQGEALWPALTLIGVSFLYGIFHAAGPGHGKAVISAYLVGHDSRLKRGIALAFASSLVQGLSAVMLVVVLAVLLGASRFAIGEQVKVLEIVSFSLVIVIGLWLAVRAWKGESCDHDHGIGPAHHDHAHHAHDHDHDHHHHDHAHDHAVTARRGLRRFWAMAAAVGIRPCSGAVLVLLFTLANGLFLLGVAATFAMALGTAMTVAALAMASVYGRKIALAFGDRTESVWRDRLHRGIGVAGSLAISAFGLLFLLATLQRGGMF
ncbi:nickel/cobalt transporter [Oceanibaculum indicum]|uniref:Nickel/cobalt efflux system n=1 Tax=Oceanibaculum indicum P24 TaxID=1207063 RepID=K2JTD0_9PROT|nr:nickel/cobalt transporter [Oceanibaculum indicum]EKE77772.1 high-affinity nickel-transporter [Oceanibaculum indicum P24]